MGEKEQRNREDEQRRLEREKRAKQTGAQPGGIQERRPDAGHERR